jgi:Replication protein C C-terminal region
MVHGIRPDELPRLTPKLKPYLQRPNPAWSDIIEAADWLRHDLGVSKSLWGDACLAMGRELAAVALAIVSTKAKLKHQAGVEIEPQRTSIRFTRRVRHSCPPPFDPPQDAEFRLSIGASALKIAASSGECGLKGGEIGIE